MRDDLCVSFQRHHGGRCNDVASQSSNIAILLVYFSSVASSVVKSNEAGSVIFLLLPAHDPFNHLQYYDPFLPRVLSVITKCYQHK